MDDQLVKYLEEQKKQRKSSNDVLSELVSSGWPDDQAQKVINEFFGIQKKGLNKSLFIFIIFFVILVVGVSVYWFMLREGDDHNTSNAVESLNTNQTSDSINTSNKNELINVNKVISNGNNLDTGEEPEYEIIFYEYGVFGKPWQYVAFQEQMQRVYTIKNAIKYYKEINEEYPVTLDKLLEKPTIKKDISLHYTNRTKNYFSDEDNIKDVPISVYTGVKFKYQIKDDNFELEYLLRDMPTETDENGWLENYGDGGWNSTDKKIEGINTLDKHFDSIEFAKQNDSDEDGLTDYDERVLYGTSTIDEDTDDDGISDYDEVQNITN